MITHRALALVALLGTSCARGTPTVTPPGSESSAPEHPASHPALASPAGSSGSSAASPAPSVLEPGAVRTPRVATPPTPAVVPAAVPTPRVPSPVRITVHAVTAAEGEDGAGNTVAATRPTAIDLDQANGWPGGAQTTTLFIGTLHFHNMGYPSATTMRFIVADGAALPTGDEVAIQYGAYAGARRVLAASLPVPR